MEIIQDHQKCAEECVMMALSSQRDSDKALWRVLAQSWARLAEQVALIEGRDDLSRGIQRCRASNSLRDSRIELIVATSNEPVGGPRPPVSEKSSCSRSARSGLSRR
jgi:hypothetical protein